MLDTGPKLCSVQALSTSVTAFSPDSQLGSIMQLVACLTADLGGYKFESQLVHITFMQIDNEIKSTVILTFSLIQEGQLSVTIESMCTKYSLTNSRIKPAQEKVSRLTD